MKFVHDDGGREAAGFRGEADDCVTRAIAIATGLPYRKVYDEITRRNREFYATSRSRKTRTRTGRPRNASAREGVYSRDIIDSYLGELGWTWVPTMQVGQGCTVHLVADELPGGTLIARVTRHMVTVIDGAIHDTDDCSRGGRRCVYGYFMKDN